MAKKRPVLLAGFGVALVLSLAIWIIVRANRAEPVYDGKPLGFWLKQYCVDGWPSDKGAGTAIREIGTNATPVLLKMMLTRSSPVGKVFFARIPQAWLVRLHLPTAADYQRKIEKRRQEGAYGFIALREKARPAIPSLVALLDEKETNIRYMAVFALRCLGPVAREALPKLMLCLNDPDFAIRDDAVMSMGTIHEDPERVVPAVTDFLQRYGNDKFLCVDAIKTLGIFGTNARGALPIIEEVLSDQDPYVRSAAVGPLAQIKGD